MDRSNLSLQRIHYDNPQHIEWLKIVWGWMLAQPHYLKHAPYSGLDEFLIRPAPTWVEIACLADEKIFALVTVSLFSLDGIVRVSLTTPIRPRHRCLIRALEAIKQDIFQSLHAKEIIAVFPSEKAKECAKLANKLGMYQIRELTYGVRELASSDAASGKF